MQASFQKVLFAIFEVVNIALPAVGIAHRVGLFADHQTTDHAAGNTMRDNHRRPLQTPKKIKASLLKPRKALAVWRDLILRHKRVFALGHRQLVAQPP